MGCQPLSDQGMPVYPCICCGMLDGQGVQCAGTQSNRTRCPRYVCRYHRDIFTDRQDGQLVCSYHATAYKHMFAGFIADEIYTDPSGYPPDHLALDTGQTEQ